VEVDGRTCIPQGVPGKDMPGMGAFWSEKWSPDDRRERVK